MMFEHAEHTKWTVKRAPLMSEYIRGVKAALNDSAARGFSKLPANVAGNIMEAGKIVKLKLTDVNGAVYQEQVGIMFQQEEFETQMAWEYDRLELALYVQALLNALALENAQMEEAFKMDKASIRQLNAEVDARNYGLIVGKANIDSQLIGCRTREVEAERTGIAKELELIAAQIETAEERLKIIAPLKELITKEQAILVLEKQKAVVLQAIIVIKEELAAIKESMIPFYEEKADAKTQKAAAIIDEIQWKEALINLGFDRIDLKTAEVAAELTENEKKELLETYQFNLIKANNTLSKAKSDYSVALTEYSSTIAKQVITLQETIKKAAIDLRIETGIDRMEVNYGIDTALKTAATTNITTEITSTVDKILAIASTLRKSSHSNETETRSIQGSVSQITQKIE